MTYMHCTCSVTCINYNRIGVVMVGVLASSAVDRAFPLADKVMSQQL
jgi:hypothetical protein